MLPRSSVPHAFSGTTAGMPKARNRVDMQTVRAHQNRDRTYACGVIELAFDALTYEHQGFSCSTAASTAPPCGTPPNAATSTELREDIRVIKMDIEPLGAPPDLLEGK
jgi:hypothetical protein